MSDELDPLVNTLMKRFIEPLYKQINELEWEVERLRAELATERANSRHKRNDQLATEFRF